MNGKAILPTTRRGDPCGHFNEVTTRKIAPHQPHWVNRNELQQSLDFCILWQRYILPTAHIVASSVSYGDFVPTINYDIHPPTSRAIFVMIFSLSIAAELQTNSALGLTPNHHDPHRLSYGYPRAIPKQQAWRRPYYKWS
jgi:hypothetical protein